MYWNDILKELGKEFSSFFVGTAETENGGNDLMRNVDTV